MKLLKTTTTRALSFIVVGRANAVQAEQMHLPELENWLTISDTLKVLVPNLDTPSEKAISEYHQIKGATLNKNLPNEGVRVF